MRIQLAIFVTICFLPMQLSLNECGNGSNLCDITVKMPWTKCFHPCEGDSMQYTLRCCGSMGKQPCYQACNLTDDDLILHRPCSARCVNGVRDQIGKCNCYNGFFGNCCDKCQDNTYCQNGGTCSLNGTQKMCICSQEFMGERCELQKPTTTTRSTEPATTVLRSFHSTIKTTASTTSKSSTNPTTLPTSLNQADKTYTQTTTPKVNTKTITSQNSINATTAATPIMTKTYAQKTIINVDLKTITSHSSPHSITQATPMMTAANTNTQTTTPNVTHKTITTHSSIHPTTEATPMMTTIKTFTQKTTPKVNTIISDISIYPTIQTTPLKPHVETNTQTTSNAKTTKIPPQFSTYPITQATKIKPAVNTYTQPTRSVWTTTLSLPNATYTIIRLTHMKTEVNTPTTGPTIKKRTSIPQMSTDPKILQPSKPPTVNDTLTIFHGSPYWTSRATSMKRIVKSQTQTTATSTRTLYKSLTATPTASVLFHLPTTVVNGRLSSAKITTNQSQKATLTVTVNATKSSASIKMTSSGWAVSKQIRSMTVSAGIHVGNTPLLKSNTRITCSHSPCVNGTCFQSSSKYMCLCIAGFEGENCEIDKNDCVDEPCLYGSCTDKVNGYDCHCYVMFKGNHCTQLETWSIVCISVPILILVVTCCCCFCITSTFKKEHEDNKVVPIDIKPKQKKKVYNRPQIWKY